MFYADAVHGYVGTCEDTDLLSVWPAMSVLCLVYVWMRKHAQPCYWLYLGKGKAAASQPAHWEGRNVPKS